MCWRQRVSSQKTACEIRRNLNVILNRRERKAGRSLLPGAERTCRYGGSKSQFDPKRSSEADSNETDMDASFQLS
jgi:hypothetical protein